MAKRESTKSEPSSGINVGRKKRAEFAIAAKLAAEEDRKAKAQALRGVPKGNKAARRAFLKIEAPAESSVIKQETTPIVAVPPLPLPPPEGVGVRFIKPLLSTHEEDLEMEKPASVDDMKSFIAPFIEKLQQGKLLAAQDLESIKGVVGAREAITKELREKPAIRPAVKIHGRVLSRELTQR